MYERNSKKFLLSKKVASMSILRNSSVAWLKANLLRSQESTMKYMLLIYHDEKRWNEIAEPDRQQIYGEFRQLREQLLSRGQFLNGSQLQPTSTATSVRVRDDKQLVTDGPFAETHEQLGGYFMIEAKNLDEATAIAARIPSARTGTIEVRALVETQAEATA